MTIKIKLSKNSVHFRTLQIVRMRKQSYPENIQLTPKTSPLCTINHPSELYRLVKRRLSTTPIAFYIIIYYIQRK